MAGIARAEGWLILKPASAPQICTIAAADPMCRGFVYWPENSHSDSLILEFFTKNAWTPDTLTPEELLPEFCRDRYQSAALPMQKAWLSALPLIKEHRQLPFEPRNFVSLVCNGVTPKKVKAAGGQCAAILTALRDILALHDDYGRTLRSRSASGRAAECKRVAHYQGPAGVSTSVYLADRWC
jgi:hypothetical protein